MTTTFESLESISQAAHMTEAELRCEIAVMLYHQERLSMGQAVQLAQMPRLAFQKLLAERGVTLHYGIDEFKADMETLHRLDNQ